MYIFYSTPIGEHHRDSSKLAYRWVGGQKKREVGKIRLSRMLVVLKGENKFIYFQIKFESIREVRKKKLLAHLVNTMIQ